VSRDSLPLHHYSFRSLPILLSLPRVNFNEQQLGAFVSFGLAHAKMEGNLPEVRQNGPPINLAFFG
jgi:hypothetical protein